MVEPSWKLLMVEILINIIFRFLTLVIECRKREMICIAEKQFKTWKKKPSLFNVYITFIEDVKETINKLFQEYSI